MSLPDSKQINTKGTERDAQSPSPANTKPSTGWYRKWYTALGFQKGYNFPLFIILGGAMLGFCLARLMYFDIDGKFADNTSPGEWFWYRAGIYRIGITLHLGCVIPAGILMVWQFVPKIRQEFMLFHRINGYLVILLLLLGNVGALMIARRAFGGGLDIQTAVGFMAIYTTVSMAMAYYNIKKLQIDQHRAWMLRTMILMGGIITTRLIMILSALIISRIGAYYYAVRCDELQYVWRDSPGYMDKVYPSCINQTSTSSYAVVHADFYAGKPDNIGTALKMSFGGALWLAIALHILGTEIYLHLTPREANRLRQVSYERQLEAGFENPGSAGLVVQNWGDADEWHPKKRTTSVGSDSTL